MRFVNKKTEEGFLNIQKDFLYRRVRMICMVANCIIISSLLFCTVVGKWHERESFITDAGYSAHLVTLLSVCSVEAVVFPFTVVMFCEGVLDRIGPVAIEVATIFVMLLVLVVTVLTSPANAASLQGQIFKDIHGYASDSGILVTIDGIITAAHLGLPVRWWVQMPLEIVGVLLYATHVFVIGSSEPFINTAFNGIFLTGLIAAAAVGKRYTELCERKSFLVIINERSRRCEAEFKLSQAEDGEPLRRRPEEVRSESAPTTAQNSAILNLHLADGADVRRKLQLVQQVAKDEHWLIQGGDVKIIDDKVLGSGGFGEVVEGVMGGMICAVKRPKKRELNRTNAKELEDVCNELRIFRHLRHPHIGHAEKNPSDTFQVRDTRVVGQFFGGIGNPLKAVAKFFRDIFIQPWPDGVGDWVNEASPTSVSRASTRTAPPRPFAACRTGQPFVRFLYTTHDCWHPHIVAFHGAVIDLDDCTVSLVLERVRGQVLHRYIQQGGELGNGPDDTARYQVLLGICRALLHLHTRNPPIVHSDLKSTNVMVEVMGHDAHPKLLDFGLARVLTRGSRTPLGGTLSWMAPEVADSRIFLRCSADIYSLGHLIAFVATGASPTQLRPQKRRRQQRVSMQAALLPSWPPNCTFEPHFRGLVESCLRFDEADRPSIEDILQMLLGLPLHLELNDTPSGFIEEVKDVASQLVLPLQSDEVSAQQSQSQQLASWSEVVLGSGVGGSLPSLPEVPPESDGAAGDVPPPPLPPVLGSRTEGTRSLASPSHTRRQVWKSLPECMSTSAMALQLTLLSTISRWNIDLDAPPCCEFHAAVRTARKICEALETKGCSSTALPHGPDQCPCCGILDVEIVEGACSLCEQNLAQSRSRGSASFRTAL